MEIFKNQCLQNDGTDVMCAALAALALISPTNIVIHTSVPRFCTTQVEPISAVGAKHDSRKHPHIAHFRWPPSALAVFLHEFPCFIVNKVNKRRMGMFKDGLLIFWIANRLFTFVRLLRGFEVIGIPQIILLLQDVCYGAIAPVTRKFGMIVVCPSGALKSQRTGRNDLLFP